MLTELVQSTDVGLSCLSEFQDFPFARPIRDCLASWTTSLRLYSLEEYLGQFVVLKAIMFVTAQIAFTLCSLLPGTKYTFKLTQLDCGVSCPDRRKPPSFV